MNLLITRERRFQRGDDGRIYTDNESTTGYKFFTRYLSVFDSVTIIGRLQNGLTTGNAVVTGQNVGFLPVPHYLGPNQYFLKIFEINKIFDSIVRNNINTSAFIARSPSNLGSLMVRKLHKLGCPFGMEVIGDPFDVFAPGAIRHPMRPLFRRWFSWNLRQQCAKASVVSYVTENSLQRRYPPSAGVFSTYYSSIQLENSDFVDHPRKLTGAHRSHELVFVGTLAQLYKAPDVLIRAVGVCLKNGVDIKLTIIGDGKCRSELEQLVARGGLRERIRFLGQLKSGAPVRNELDKADLFVLPSKGEGLPRAMIEAMARGLPCIGTFASGIPELLHAEDMVEAGNVTALAAKIQEVISSPSRMMAMSERNLNKSRDFFDDILQKRRVSFFRELRRLTEDFQKRSRSSRDASDE